MNSSTKPAAVSETYSEVVDRLDSIVSALESGSLSLEESLERFSEGIGLVKRGEKMLADAEKKIEQLLAEDGSSTALDVSSQPR